MSNAATATHTPISNRLYPQFTYQRTPSVLLPMPMPVIPERIFLPEVGIGDVFELRIATDDATEDTAFGVRYEVFCQEMGWDFTTSGRREFNATDQHAVQVVAYHRPTGRPVGCYRLIMADPANPMAPFPIEGYCSGLVRGSIPDSANARLGCAEISRFCLVAPIRSYDATKDGPPWGISEQQWADEARHRLGLTGLMWMTLAHIATALRLDYLVTLAEARLQEAGRKIGFNFHPIGDSTDFYGPRIPYRIDRRSLRAPLLVPQTAALLSTILPGIDAGIRRHPMLRSYLSSRTERINRG